MTHVSTFDKAALRRVLNGTAGENDYRALGIDTLLAACSDPENVVRAPLESAVLTRAAGRADGARSITYVMSTEQPVGPQRNLVLQRGWDLRDFDQRGRPFLYDHNMTDANGGLPLGNMSGLRVGRSGGMRALVGTGNFTPPGLVPFNDMVFELADQGWLRGFSVGFRVLDGARQPTDQERERFAGFGEYSLVFERSQLLEGSVTAVGQDPAAVKLRSGLASGVQRGAWKQEHAEALLYTLGLRIPQGRSFVPMSTTSDMSFGAGVEDQCDESEIDARDQQRVDDDHRDLIDGIVERHVAAMMSDAVEAIRCEALGAMTEALAQESEAVRSSLGEIEAAVNARVATCEAVLGYTHGTTHEQRADDADAFGAELDTILGIAAHAGADETADNDDDQPGTDTTNGD